ncbi:Ig-like domain-containing protein [Dysgonomonas sp. 521]|uniref:Ig-like domain-containing protein n=1 Tax=Dysgonomonas sp. 521 TaxID=2302932 RepID=UPI0013D68538|nr:Ig-like domain-containing protein [Dysgonomonas sp. 521]NDV95375.1 Ig-like domain-containing protein [Dysgonomonas sp. 521]
MNKLIYTIAALLTLTLFSACGGDDNNNEVVVLTSIAIDPVDKDLYIGDTYQLTVSHQPADVKLPKLTWTSSDTKVATVSSSGKVTAVADGVAKITASYGDLSNSVTLVVSKIQDYTSFVISINSVNDFRDCIAGYYTQDGLCKKLGDLGNLTSNKYSPEIKVDIDTLQYVHIYYDLYDMNGIYDFTGKVDTILKLKKNIKNIFILSNNKGIEVSKENKTQYPH